MMDKNHIKRFNEESENLNIKKSKKSYYHLQESADGRFTNNSTIALIESDTTEEERIELANYYTKYQFTKYPGFYQLIGPIDTPFILSYE